MAKKETNTADKIEREYIIPLREKVNKVPRYKRANKAVRTIKEFLARHMKVYDKDLNKIKIDKYLNEVIWSRGIKKPPMKIKIKAIKEGDIVKVELVEMPEKIKFKKLKKEKAETEAKKIAEKKKAEQKPEEKEEIKSDEEEKKKEEGEKKAAVVETGKEIEKAVAKQEKHTTKVKSPKQEKNARTGYNKSSRGH